MRFITELDRDTDNSRPGEAELKIVETGRGRFLEIKLAGPDREVWINVGDIRKVIEDED